MCNCFHAGVNCTLSRSFKRHTNCHMLVIISSSRAFPIVRSCFMISTRGGQLYHWKYVLLIASNNVSQLQQSLRNNFARAFDGPFVTVTFLSFGVYLSS